MLSCKDHPACSLLYKNGGSLELHDIYRVYLGKRQGQHVWIVNGAKVMEEIYPAFVMGGNDQRYRFNPDDEVWIDNRIGLEELEYTIAHELIERKLMREKGFSYDRAHSEGGLATEKLMRLRQQRKVEAKELATGPVKPGEVGDKDNGETIRLSGIYRQLYRKKGGISVWIVDGSVVRREIHGDFCFGGHDLKYNFIPAGEIWLDAAMTAEEARFALLHEATERKLMASGQSYDDAYPDALVVQLDERLRQARRARRHEARLASVPYGTRERGVKK